MRRVRSFALLFAISFLCFVLIGCSSEERRSEKNKVSDQRLTETTLEEEEKTTVTGLAAELVGKWASHEVSNINGADASDDELFTFNGDGTFTDVIVTNGPISSGTIIEKGKFKVDGDQLLLYDCLDSWSPKSDSGAKKAYQDKPVEDSSYELEFVDANTVRIGIRTYERVE